MRRLETLHVRLGYLRLLLVAGTVAAGWWSLREGRAGDRSTSLWWLVVPVAMFAGVAVHHSRVLRRRSLVERALAFLSKGLARIEGRWIGAGQTAPRGDTASSLYAADLDLFGRGSLFDLLSTARSRMGEETLADWLLAPAKVEEIRRRQAAVAELRDRLNLREDLAVLGDDLRTSVDPGQMLLWAEGVEGLKPGWIRWLAATLAACAMLAAVSWARWGPKAPFLVILIGEVLVAWSLRRQVEDVLRGTERAVKGLQLLSSLLRRMERERFEAPLLQALTSKLLAHSTPGSIAIAGLSSIAQFIESRNHPLLRALDKPLMYSVQVAYAAQAWRRVHGGAVRGWLEAVGEMEALASLATYSYEHPEDPFPEFVGGQSGLEAEELGHPLLPPSVCVRNDIRISDGTRVLLISGSNMSGKSTLLRALGLNTVLAMAGGPVRARHMEMTPLRVGASILVNDSLQEGSSRFYAEITRLREICQLAEGQLPVLFLLDELLQGTNSKDRLEGAEGVLRTLVESGAIGVVSTHDLALTGMDAGGRELKNLHLEDAIRDGRMVFDFKLREEVVTKSNGVELMRMIGLRV